MNWLKKGPDLKVSDLKVPDFAFDLYYDLKERHLLPLVVLLVVAMVAAPIYVKGSTKQDSEPLPRAAPIATGSNANAAGESIVVARSAPGLRDLKRRLKGARALDPFEQRDGEATPAAESAVTGEGAPAIGASTSTPVEIPAEATVVGAEPSYSPPIEAPTPIESPLPPETGESAESRVGKTGGKTRTRFESSAIDVRIVSVPAKSAGSETPADAKPKTPQAQVRRNLPELTMLPARSTPAATFMGTSRDGKKALMLVSSDVVSIFGEASCVIGSQSCQLLALEPELPETFVYGPNERTFRIELLRINRTLSAKPRRATLGITKHDRGTAGDGSGNEPAAGQTTGEVPAGRG
jgi:hypothetical protein